MIYGWSKEGAIEIYFIFLTKKVGNKIEIFSSMRASDLKSVEYLNYFYPDMPDDCEAEGQTHRWHKKDDKFQSCYHCHMVIKS